MDDHRPGLRPRDSPRGHGCPHALFQPLPPQPAPLPGIYLNAVAGVFLTPGDTLGQAIFLGQVHHTAKGPRLSKTDKPPHRLARRGACDPRPGDPNAPGPDRALLHLTMKHTAQLPATLAGERHFIVEGLTDDVITPASTPWRPPRTLWTMPWDTPRHVRTWCRNRKTP